VRHASAFTLTATRAADSGDAKTVNMPCLPLFSCCSPTHLHLHSRAPVDHISTMTVAPMMAHYAGGAAFEPPLVMIARVHAANVATAEGRSSSAAPLATDADAAAAPTAPSPMSALAAAAESAATVHSVSSAAGSSAGASLVASAPSSSRGSAAAAAAAARAPRRKTLLALWELAACDRVAYLSSERANFQLIVAPLAPQVVEQLKPAIAVLQAAGEREAVKQVFAFSGPPGGAGGAAGDGYTLFVIALLAAQARAH